MKHKIYIFSFLAICIFFFFNASESYAQTDTAFWFAAPYIAKDGWGGRQADRPIVFRITTGSQIANVTISQPANGGMPTQNVTIPANSTQRIEVTTWVNDIENYPANMTLNNGIKITSNVPVTAYYQVETFVQGGVPSPPNARCSPEVFTLKGQDALGTDFWIPTQNEFYNDTLFSSSNPMPRNAFIIVATQDNTQVTITPSHAITGHNAGIPFVINLNKGQTYSARAKYAAANGHLIGSKVSSNKPIAITVNDDHLEIDGGDLSGDQIVPNQLLGTQYIALNGLLDIGNGIAPGSISDYVFLVATENNTQISINGNLVATLNSGESYAYDFNGADVVYISATNPVATWHVSGSAGQSGAAEIPKLTCAGSSSVAYVRTLVGPLLFNVVVQSGGQNDFTINGNPNILTGTMFSPVPGTGGNWQYCQLNMNDLQATTYPYEGIIHVENSAHYFQLSVMDGCMAPGLYWGASLGYFTDYGKEINNSDTDLLGSDTFICPGDMLVLDATTSGATGYEWSTGAATPSISINTPGTYWVHVNGSFCTFISDTIHVFQKPSIKDLGNDTSLCSGHSITLDATTPGATGYLWSTGATTPSISVDSPGTYWAHVDGDFCKNNDTIVISLRQIPKVDLGNDTTICKGSLVTLNSNASPDANELWSTGAVTPSINVRDSGVYWVNVNYPNCGNVSDTIAVNTVSCNCEIGLPTAFSPNGDGKNDIFKPIIGPDCFFEEYDFRIYNRYGQLIFRSKNPDKGWDGTENGAQADLGVYMYYITYRNILNSTREVRKGDVTLLR